MAIKEWPGSERPREKLLVRGPQSLSDGELLSIFIGSGVPGASAVEIGRALLKEYGGLRSILNADESSLCTMPGIGQSRYATLQAAVELGKRYCAEKAFRDGPLSSPASVAEFLMSKLRDREREIFAVVYLDNRNCVLHYDELFMGTINGASVHPREVVKSVLRHNAAAIVISHNHPSGVAEPSQSDTAITRKLKEALELVDVKLLDHLVIGDGEYVSLNERGLI